MSETYDNQEQILHRQCYELLPWLLNGSLDDSESQRVRDHINQCSECAREYEAQARVRQLMQREESVLYAPHASMRKLMARIDADEAQQDVSSNDSREPVQVPVPRRRQWLAAAVVVQTIGLIGLATVQNWKINEVREAPRYSTLSAAPAGLSHGPAARVVFAPSTSVEQLSTLLLTNGARIVDGPSEAGVFTLVFPAARDQDEVSSTIEKLRADPKVRFAEPAVAETGAAK